MAIPAIRMIIAINTIIFLLFVNNLYTLTFKVILSSCWHLCTHLDQVNLQLQTFSDSSPLNRYVIKIPLWISQHFLLERANLATTRCLLISRKKRNWAQVEWLQLLINVSKRRLTVTDVTHYWVTPAA